MVVCVKMMLKGSKEALTVLIFTHVTVLMSKGLKVVFVAYVHNTDVSLCLRMQNAVSAQPCVGKLGISPVLLNFLDCNFRLWLETP